MSFFISEAFAEPAAAAANQAQPGGANFIIMMIGMIVIFYFLLIRPQQKRAKEHREMINAISKGDEISTNGGLLGKIVELNDQYITLEIAEGVQVKCQRHAVSNVLPKGSLKAAAKE